MYEEQVAYELQLCVPIRQGLLSGSRVTELGVPEPRQSPLPLLPVLLPLPLLLSDKSRNNPDPEPEQEFSSEIKPVIG